MKFKVSAELGYDVRSSSTIVLNIHALRTAHQTILSESLTISPAIDAEELTNITTENRFVRLDIPEPGNYNIRYEAVVDNCFEVRSYAEYSETPLGSIDAGVFVYLNPSRYCQSDKLYRLAENTFGKIKGNYNKVVAITRWIHQNVEYLSGFSNSETSAYDTVTQQAGVCRDFAHLGIALCRALTIPARYFTGYSYMLIPQDFHACFEAYIGNQWLLFDATRLAPLNGLVKIATGRDAADAAIASIFGNVFSINTKASCEMFENEPFVPVYYPPSVYDAYTYS
ncbi:transglutaminase family protein [Mucilaginibacter litoreus]|uniref:Transglutaminase family protein n=1 Tax=Mucilaginibacter litoreus TaxID=1048221 RepID=A0ABW3AWB8_9SPHI